MHLKKYLVHRTLAKKKKRKKNGRTLLFQKLDCWLELTVELRSKHGLLSCSLQCSCCQRDPVSAGDGREKKTKNRTPSLAPDWHVEDKQAHDETGFSVCRIEQQMTRIRTSVGASLALPWAERRRWSAAWEVMLTPRCTELPPDRADPNPSMVFCAFQGL